MTLTWCCTKSASTEAALLPEHPRLAATKCACERAVCMHGSKQAPDTVHPRPKEHTALAKPGQASSPCLKQPALAQLGSESPMQPPNFRKAVGAPLDAIVLGDLVLGAHVLRALAPLGHPVAGPVHDHVEVHACHQNSISFDGRTRRCSCSDAMRTGRAASSDGDLDI